MFGDLGEFYNLVRVEVFIIFLLWIFGFLFSFFDSIKNLRFFYISVVCF